MPPYARRTRYFIAQSFQIRFSVLLIIVSLVVTTLIGIVLFKLVNQSLTVFISQRMVTHPEVLHLLQQQRSWILTTLFVTFLGMTVVLLLLGIYISHRVAGPLFALSRRMRELSQGDFNALLSLRTTDEFQDLKEDYNAVVRSLQNRLKEDLLKLSQILNQITAGMTNLEKEALSPRLIEPLQSSFSSLQKLYEHKNKLLQPGETFKPKGLPEELIL